MKRTALVAAAALVLAGCGSSDETEPEVADESPAAEKSPRPLIVRGALRVDDLFSVRVRRDGTCSASSEVGTDLSEGTRAVVIRNSSGDEVALGEIVGTSADIIEGTDTAEPGVCFFNFYAEVPEREDGVYTAAVPDLDVEARFTESDASSVGLTFDP